MKDSEFNIQSRRHAHLISIPYKLLRGLDCKYCTYSQISGCFDVVCTDHDLHLIYIDKKDRTI